MGTSERAHDTTYEDQYRSLGYLFYSIAACDRNIIQAEINALKEMTARHWLMEDRSYDELGIESARYIDIAFDHALEQRLSSKDAYARFVEDQLREPRRFDGWTKSLIPAHGGGDRQGFRIGEPRRSNAHRRLAKTIGPQPRVTCGAADDLLHEQHKMSASRTFSILAALCCALPSFSQVADTTSMLPVHRSLKDALHEPERVRILDLSDQHIGLLPREIALLINLEELRLHNDDLTELPEEIGDLRKLRILDLSGNPIRHLPVHFKDLNMLDELYLNGDSNFDLEQDMKTLALLPHLRILHLENDGITLLPESIASLHHLEELYLNDNKLRTFPSAVIRMDHLKLLDLHHNPLNPLVPLELQQRGVLVRF
ncbi:MAG: leucine-rich repeat domain-containing protein [Flavobacteriales bacterium]|nr:leucine-rich repeat domain-containing protein [Flavobacteriales bacterium]